MDKTLSISSKKILVIDDEVAAVTYLTTVLEDHGYQACSATQADAAAAVARDERPDLICMDIMMPKRSGVALYQDFKQDPATRDIPVVFVSAFSQVHGFKLPHFFQKLVSQQRVPEPEAYIEKPIGVADFLETIETLIGPPSLQHNVK